MRSCVHSARRIVRPLDHDVSYDGPLCIVMINGRVTQNMMDHFVVVVVVVVFVVGGGVSARCSLVFPLSLITEREREGEREREREREKERERADTTQTHRRTDTWARAHGAHASHHTHSLTHSHTRTHAASPSCSLSLPLARSRARQVPQTRDGRARPRDSGGLDGTGATLSFRVTTRRVRIASLDNN